jgi:4-amino-4-deoxy-L-arabinose transferase-like glycosyltransferase
MKVNRISFIVFSCLFGCLITWYFSENITKFLFGLSFSGRSLKTQAFLSLLYTLTFSSIMVAINFLTSRIKILRSIIFFSFIAAAFFLIIRVICYQYQLITYPFQLEYREGATLLFTQAILEGKNIFSLQQAPLYTNGYGVVYNLIIIPFAKLFGNTLLIHRFFTAIFSFASTGLIIYTIYSKNKNVLAALFGGISFLISQLYWVIPTARADATGLFFFLLSILIPYFNSYSYRSLILSAIFGLIAFYTKPYFVISIPIIASFIFLFLSKKKGLFIIFFSVGISLISILIVNYFYETYFYNVIYVHTKIVSDQVLHANKQVYQFLLAYFPTIVGGCLILFSEKGRNSEKVISTFIDWKKSLRFNLINFSEPLINFKFDVFGYFLICSTIIIYFTLGRHIGSYMVYLFQLMTPFLIIQILGRLTSGNPYRLLILSLFVVNILTFRSDYQLDINLSDWKKAKEYIQSSQSILNSPALTQILVEKNKPIIDSGQTQYFFVPLDYSSNHFLPESKEIQNIQSHFKNAIRSEINNRGYDYVMVSTWDSPFANTDELNENYQVVDALYLPMPQSNQNWLKPAEDLDNHFWEISIWMPK